MILSDADIVRRLEEGDLVVDPLDDPDLQIQPASVDLRLGRSFLEFQHANIPCIHPESERETEEYVDETVVREDGEYVLHPGDFVLGTTRERVEIPPDLIAHVEGRSSLGRLAVVVHASLPYDEEVLLWTPTEGLAFHEIGEVVETEQPARAVAFDPRTLRVSTHRVTDYITNPTQRIHRVRLRSGREVRVTKDHNLFTLDERGGVTRIPSENAEGQFVMVPATLPESPGTVRKVDVLDLLDPEETTLYASDGSGEVDRSTAPDGLWESSEQRDGLPMTAVPRSRTPAGVEAAVRRDDARLPRELPLTPEFGWALGFYLAKGNTRRAQIRVSDADRDRLDRFAAFFDPYDVGLSWQDDEQTTTLTVRSATWSKVFPELTGTGSLSPSVLNWPETVLDALLEGVLDGSSRRERARETLYTASLELANRLAYLGTRLGRPTSVHSCGRCENDPGRAGQPWVVDFGGDASECERVPVPGELLRDLRQETGVSPAAVADAAGWSSDARVATLESEACQTVERGTLERTRDAYRELDGTTDRLDQILDGDVRFEEVVAVERTDRVEPTYDLEVQPNGRTIENFVGGRGGVFLSNTAGLCDPGYKGQITLELSNLGRAPVALTPGMRVSQLTFTELTSPAERPYGSERGSKYQGQSGPVASRIQDDAEFGGDQ